MHTVTGLQQLRLRRMEGNCGHNRGDIGETRPNPLQCGFLHHLLTASGKRVIGRLPLQMIRPRFVTTASQYVPETVPDRLRPRLEENDRRIMG